MLRSFWNRLPLIGRLLLSASLTLLAAGAVLLFVSAQQEAAEVRLDLKSELARELETQPAALAEMVVIGDFAALQQALDYYVARELIVEAEFRDVTGATVHASSGRLKARAPDWFKTLFDFPDASGKVAVAVGGREYGELSLTLTAQGMLDRSWRHLKDRLALLMLAIALEFVGIWLVLRAGLAPLKQLEAGADAMAAGQLEIDLTPAGSPELRHVMASFERMAKRVLAAQTAILQSEERLQLAVGGVNDGIWDWDLAAGTYYISAGWKAMFGYADDELPNRLESLRDNLHPDDKERALRLIEDFLDGKVALYAQEYRMRHKDGSWRWILSRGEALRDRRGRAYRMTGSHVDVSSRKATEQALAESEARFRDFFEKNRSVMLLIDPENGQVADANQAAANFYGYPLARLIGADMAMINPLPRELVYAQRQLAMREKRNYFNFVHLLASGEKRDVEVYSTPTATDGKKLLFSIVHDITERKQVEAALHQSEQNFRQQSRRLAEVIWGTNIGTWEWNLASGEMLFNARCAEIVGYRLEELEPVTFGTWAGLMHPDEFQRAHALLRLCLQGEAEAAEFEIRMRHKDGSWVWVQVRGRVVETGADGQPLRMSGMHQCITERKLAESRLQLAASVFTHAREGIMITAVDGTIIEVNDTFSRITGYSREEAVGQNPRILKSGRQPPEYYDAMWRALQEKGHWYGEAWNRRKDGNVYAEMIAVSAVFDAAGAVQNYVALFTDITPMKEHEQQLEHIAHYDALTSLPNRVLLADRLRQALAQCERRGQSLALVYLDLDGFKAVNDNHGHEVGDELLIAVAQRMKAALREGDTIARIGGDEFVAVLGELELQQDCEPVLARLLRAASSEVEVGALTLRVSASIGVTLYPQDGVDADLLMRHADQAMYLAKQSGKNRYHLFDVSQDEAAKSQRESIEQIGAALARREFVLHYQPKVNMRSGAVIGAEALIRWQHPERGLLAPSAFLPVIEEHALSVELGEWVIDSALAQMEAWHAAGFDLPVSVNVGARQLQQAGFVLRLGELLRAHPDVQPCCLELEILETSALEDIMQVSEVMHACRALGVRFALDDFGTGYSSLTYLKRLPVELLKIDQSFVRDMLEDPENLAIIEGVVGLATAFRRQVIAEGVETVAHGELLLPLGCELAQGYGIARAMPGADLPGWAASWRPDPAWSAWNGRATNRDDAMTAFAEVEHRHWLRAIGAFLEGERNSPPPLDAQNCHFGRWQAAEGRVRFGARPEFALVTAAHEKIHELGQELVKLHQLGEKRQARARLGQLQALHDELSVKLRELVRPRRA